MTDRARNIAKCPAGDRAMPITTIVFNAKATEFMSEKSPTKVRVNASWNGTEGLLLRPTTRKTGPHIMLPLEQKARGYVVQIDEAVLEKMVEEGMPSDFLQAGERYSVMDETYGWVALLPGEEHEAAVGLATVQVKKEK
jgi:hypothetical protein